MSLAFPAVAAFVKHPETWPKWWGVLDVALAFLLAALVCVVLALARNQLDSQVEHTTYRAYRFLHHGVLLIGTLFIAAGDRIIWTQCLTGFAWRYWLLLYALPWWIAAFRPPLTKPP